ncbi:hypothetical protein Kirov_198 [Bacillus phage Kirov]|uniref:Uncharacterized protein n=1 Tax=Bacillus phage Kirov TaxID=2783539 RepID=A0A7U3RX44_9CAUD|nr:hypothetical protein PQE67_gp106 [Bacillus phage Kirov]QOV08397.1 hypothetical protein Kirov_198 [Bacillus phage Kirov]
MGQIEIRLTEKDIFKALHEYVANHYPNMRSKEVTIYTRYNSVQYAISKAEYKKENE